MTIVALFGTLAAAHPLLGPIVVIAALPTLALKMARTPGTHAIDVRGVSFTYPGSSRPALRNVSFSIRPGEKVALVGENGSGKTTLVQLLFGLLPPSHGEILYDGRDVRELEAASLWRQATAVFQDYVQYHLTARDNVGFGNVQRLHDDELLRRAAEKGGATDGRGSVGDVIGIRHVVDRRIDASSRGGELRRVRAGGSAGLSDL